MSGFTGIRTRFAPSPTGYMHVGNLRTALYAYLIAKKDPNGKFILRIEDTDRERYVEGAVDIIYQTLRETGLVHDEGPDVGGPAGPYVQSERFQIYKDYAQKLIDSGQAYRCFCDKDRLDALKAEQDGKKQTHLYDKRCLRLSRPEIEEKLSSGVPFVIRQNTPDEGSTTFHDEIYGEVTVENREIDDQILIKSDGYPTYNFANVVDDHLMGITHVIRGTEYLSSAPKYNLLYAAFGWNVPEYIHCPPVMKDAHNKLSKRNGDASYEDLIAKGYLSDAVLNYIALLGWSPGGENEIFTLPELVQAFDIAGISKSPAIFDPDKLRWMSGEYMKRLPPEEFLRLARPYIQKAAGEGVPAAYVAALLQGRCDILSEIPDHLDFIKTLPDYAPELFVHKKMKTTLSNSLDALLKVLPELEAIEDWTEEIIHDSVFALIERLGVKNGMVLWPLRVALSGKMSTPGGGVEIAYILGKDETVSRVKAGIQKLSK